MKINMNLDFRLVCRDDIKGSARFEANYLLQSMPFFVRNTVHFDLHDLLQTLHFPFSSSTFTHNNVF